MTSTQDKSPLGYALFMEIENRESVQGAAETITTTQLIFTQMMKSPVDGETIPAMRYNRSIMPGHSKTVWRRSILGKDGDHIATLLDASSAVVLSSFLAPESATVSAFYVEIGSKDAQVIQDNQETPEQLVRRIMKVRDLTPGLAEA